MESQSVKETVAAIPAQSQEGGRGPCQRGDKGGKGEGKVRQGEMEEEGGLVTSKWGGGKGKERRPPPTPQKRERGEAGPQKGGKKGGKGQGSISSPIFSGGS